GTQAGREGRKASSRSTRRGRATKTLAKPSATASSASAAEPAAVQATRHAASWWRRYRVPKARRSPWRAFTTSSLSLSSVAPVRSEALGVSPNVVPSVGFTRKGAAARHREASPPLCTFPPEFSESGGDSDHNRPPEPGKLGIPSAQLRT